MRAHALAGRAQSGRRSTRPCAPARTEEDSMERTRGEIDAEIKVANAAESAAGGVKLVMSAFGIVGTRHGADACLAQPASRRRCRAGRIYPLPSRLLPHPRDQAAQGRLVRCAPAARPRRRNEPLASWPGPGTRARRAAHRVHGGEHNHGGDPAPERVRRGRRRHCLVDPVRALRAWLSIDRAPTPQQAVPLHAGRQVQQASQVGRDEVRRAPFASAS